MRRPNQVTAIPGASSTDVVNANKASIVNGGGKPSDVKADAAQSGVGPYKRTASEEYMQLMRLRDSLDKPETEEQRRARERREATSRIISGIGDVASAFANMYFTKQRGLAADTGSKLSDAARARFDRAREGREKNDARYLATLKRMSEMEEADAKDEQTREQKRAELELKQREQDRKDKDQERKDAEIPYKIAYWDARAKKAASDAERSASLAMKAKYEAEATPEQLEASLEKIKSQTGLNNARANKIRMGGKAKISSGTRTTTIYGADGLNGVDIPTTAWNGADNVDNVWKDLPPAYKTKVKDKFNREVKDAKPKKDQMKQDIGDYMADYGVPGDEIYDKLANMAAHATGTPTTGGGTRMPGVGTKNNDKYMPR